MSMASCVFCDISTNQIISHIIYQNNDVICFLPLKPQVYGHTIIATKQHYQDIFFIPDTAMSSVMNAIKFLAIHYKKQLGAQGINLLHASGTAAQQSVLHFHIHMLPRFEQDNLNLWPNLPNSSYDIEALAKKLRIQ
ncbi:MAG: HIT family protein [Anaerolineaceae bacterium]|nr:HIT family protein [Anaerolineaceae bacterium]